MLVCDFLVVVTASLRQLYAFVRMEIATRRVLHCYVTAHPTAAWTLQQFREALPSDHGHKFLIPDPDSIFSAVWGQYNLTLGFWVSKRHLGSKSKAIFQRCSYTNELSSAD
jgi:hypothetical protein